MILTLLGRFTDLIIDGEYSESPFVDGDQFKVSGVKVSCSLEYPGCCESSFIISHEGWNDGEEFEASCYLDAVKIQDWPHGWEMREARCLPKKGGKTNA